MSRGRKYLAYGVEPGRRATYELRQSRYCALATTIAQEARARGSGDRPLKLLDVGVNDGITLRYLEPQLEGQNVALHGVDLFPRGKDAVYQSHRWDLHQLDLEQGMPNLPSASFDVVACEQVLEHLSDVKPAIEDMCRVLRPGGLMIIGVPIFPFGLHAARPYAVKVVDRLFGPRKRGHVQAWSLRSLTRQLTEQSDLTLEQSRGFRIISGGILRPLEFCAWWWRWNSWVGRQVPSLCIEVQLLLRKSQSRSH